MTAAEFLRRVSYDKNGICDKLDSFDTVGEDDDENVHYGDQQTSQSANLEQILPVQMPPTPSPSPSPSPPPVRLASKRQQLSRRPVRRAEQRTAGPKQKQNGQPLSAQMQSPSPSPPPPKRARNEQTLSQIDLRSHVRTLGNKQSLLCSESGKLFAFGAVVKEGSLYGQNMSADFEWSPIPTFVSRKDAAKMTRHNSSYVHIGEKRLVISGGVDSQTLKRVRVFDYLK